ncbi:hypothetical protein PanWU01x14_006720 [Parasponia andersonii]|uniref:Uncharacterized protein n=1 Tax=Parasponia andersonii TaxID=3476 RepID=A0A2P5E3W4_PARAD|nr:hypothetical protein PanWU01x14_006720 [Parasponia andersonii]
MKWLEEEVFGTRGVLKDGQHNCHGATFAKGGGLAEERGIGARAAEDREANGSGGGGNGVEEEEEGQEANEYWNS